MGVDQNVHTNAYNTSVKSIKLPDGLKTVRRNFVYAFMGLTSVVVPKSVTMFERSPFYHCTNISDITFEQGGTEPLIFEDGKTPSVSGSHIDGKEGVFGTYYTDTIDIGTSSMRTIEYDYRLKIESIVLPSRTQRLGEYAFYKSHVKSVTFDGDLSYLEKQPAASDAEEGEDADSGKILLEIGEGAFEDCVELKDFKIPDNTKILGSESSIGQPVFRNVTLSEIKLPDTLETIGGAAFGYVKFVGEQDTLVFPKNLKTIGMNAFSAGDPFHFKTLDFSKSSQLTKIDQYAFSNIKELESVTFAEATAESPAFTIGMRAFSSDPLLDNVELPANLTTMNQSIFENDTGLKTFSFATYKENTVRDGVDISGKSDLTKIDKENFLKTGIESIVFPESTAEEITLGENLFKQCTSLTYVKLSTSIKKIDNVFSGCSSIKSVEVAAGSGNFSTPEGSDLPALYDKDGKSILYVYSAVEGEVRILAGDTVGASAFKGQAGIKKITIGPSIKTIADYAFKDCVYLESVEFQAGSTLQTIGKYAFDGCYNLQTINLQNCQYLETIDNYAFNNTDSLTSIVLPASVKMLGTYAFYYSGASKIDLSACTQLTEIKESTFAFTSNLNEVKFPASVTKVGAALFRNSTIGSVDLSVCTGLEAIATGTYGMFQNCTQLTEVKLPASLVFLGTNTFNGCTSLTEVDLSNTKIEFFSSTSGKTGTGTLNVFNNCSSLETVKFPATLKYIGANAFNGTESLKEIYIGELDANDFTGIETFVANAFSKSGLTSAKISGKSTFNKAVFSDCAKLKSIEIEDAASLTTIPESMFSGCANLSSFDFTKLTELTTIGKEAFKGCALLTTADLSFCKGQTSTTASKTFLGSGSTNSGIFQDCTSLTSVKLPANVDRLGNSVFQNTGFSKIDFSVFQNIKTWGTNTFKGCVNLTNLTLTKDLKGKFGTNTFQDCTGLQTVTVKADYGYEIPNYMFAGCTSLKTVTFEDGYSKNIGQYAFQNDTELTTVKFGSGQGGTVGNYAFSGCSALTDINLGVTKFTSFGTWMFNKCVNLKSADLRGSTATKLGDHMFDGCESLSDVKLSSTINYLGIYTFQNCVGLKEIDLSNTKLNRITTTTATSDVTYSSASYVFNGCTSLQRVILPVGVTQIAGYAFQNCISLETIENLNMSELTHIGTFAFANCVKLFDGQTIDLSGIPDSKGVVAEGAFLGCGGIVGFTASGATNIQYSSSSRIYDLSAENGFLFVTQNNVEDPVRMIIAGPYDAIVENGTLKLTGDYTLPAKAFQNFNLEGITKLDLSALDHMDSVPSNAFNGSSFSEIILPDTVTEIGGNAFQNCLNLTTVVLPEGLTKINTYAFSGSGITTIEIPASVTSIANGAFANTASLQKVTFAEPADGEEGEPLSMVDGSTSNSVFINSAIQNITFPARLAKIPAYGFYNTKLQSVVIPETVSEIGNYAFTGSALTSVTFEGNPTVGTYLFQNCASLATVDFGPCTTINTREFEGTALTDLTIPDTVTTIGQYAFRNCLSLTRVHLPEGLEQIQNYTFSGCTALESVDIPDSVTGFLGNCFENCESLTSITIPENVTALANAAFSGCTSLEGDLVLPDTLVTLGGNVFANCTKLHSVELAATVTSSLNATTFTGWTEKQEIRFRCTAFEVAASSMGVSWLRGLGATVIFNYGTEN